MGITQIQAEVFHQPLTLDFNGLTPVKTEPVILRSIAELISAQMLTQQIVAQLASSQIGNMQGGQAFIRQAQRPNEAVAFNDSADQVRTLTQRVEELERRLEESAKTK